MITVTDFAKIHVLPSTLGGARNESAFVRNVQRSTYHLTGLLALDFLIPLVPYEDTQLVAAGDPRELFSARERIST